MHPNDGRVVSNFIVQALQNEPITIYGDGMQSRSFCYVDDLIEALIRLMNTEDDFTGPVNIGNPDEFTMLELAENVIELTGMLAAQLQFNVGIYSQQNHDIGELIRSVRNSNLIMGDGQIQH